ncbi:glycosyltransferase family 2 protein [Micrococcus luteus]|uniref:glycosyltransferase family 2 protein n=1 Tax=Micrococcus luteus TaxID=1270 RepID=UPI003EB75922
MSEFSVIIPTLQRAAELHELVEMCAAHPRVLEVLVINNAREPLAWGSPKVRVLQQAENIYVNPAWNLGAREARGKYLAILNDDVLFEPELLDAAADWLTDHRVGVIGAHPDAYLPGADASPRLGRRIVRRPNGFGVVMFLRRDAYIPIPADLLVYGGDEWLVRCAPGTPRGFKGGRLRTPMSATSGGVEFSPLKAREMEWMMREFHRVGRPSQRAVSLAQLAKRRAGDLIRVGSSTR